MVHLAVSEGICPFPPNQPRYTSWILRMGGPDRNVRGILRIGIGSHLVLGLLLRPLPGPWGQGRGGPKSGNLDTVSYLSPGRDFDLNLIHHLAD